MPVRKPALHWVHGTWFSPEMKWKIRQETAGDEAAIAQVTAAAFAGKVYADGEEAELPAKLRDAGALVLSLVAVEGKTVIGHIAMSPARIGDAKCLGLGPVSVRPNRQGRGIGSALVNHALAVAGVYGRGGGRAHRRSGVLRALGVCARRGCDPSRDAAKVRPDCGICRSTQGRIDIPRRV